MKYRVPLFLAILSMAAVAVAPLGAQPPAPAEEAALASASRAGAAALPGPAVDPPSVSRTKLDAMLADLRQKDPPLAALVATMNEARGPAEADAVAAVIDDLVARRVAATDSLEAMAPWLIQP